MHRLSRRIALAALVVLGSASALRMPWRGLPGPHQPEPLAGPMQGPADHILIEKSARRLTLFRGGEARRIYRIALGFAPAGDKQREGDGRTPEGRFTIDRRNPQSAYHLSLGISYPRPEDRARARLAGYSPGGDIMIHGQPNARPDDSLLPGDWTAGCIAVSNAEMREIWAAVANGTTVEILA